MKTTSVSTFDVGFSSKSALFGQLRIEESCWYSSSVEPFPIDLVLMVGRADAVPVGRDVTIVFEGVGVGDGEPVT